MPPASPSAAAPDLASTRKLLNIVLVIGIADLLLFLVLMYVAFVDRSDSMVSLIGPIHGVGFVALVGLTAKGAVDGRWGWWFPGITLITTGPPGSIIGDLILRKQLRDHPDAR
jgi:integral membrane protein